MISFHTIYGFLVVIIPVVVALEATLSSDAADCGSSSPFDVSPSEIS